MQGLSGSHPCGHGSLFCICNTEIHEKYADFYCLTIIVRFYNEVVKTDWETISFPIHDSVESAGFLLLK